MWTNFIYIQKHLIYLLDQKSSSELNLNKYAFFSLQGIAFHLVLYLFFIFLYGFLL